MPNSSFYSALAKSILAGEMTVDPIVDRTRRTLGKQWPWLRPLARRYLATFEVERRPRLLEVIEFLINDEGLKRAHRRFGDKVGIADWIPEPNQMRPVAAASEWKIPAIDTVRALADWLCLSPSELEWFADLKRLGARLGQGRIIGPIGHYHYRILAKNYGSLRLIEAPKQRLKGIQQKILKELLNRIPPHPAAHGFVKGRSIKTFAAAHAGKRVVLRMDLKDFFPSLPGGRIQAFYRIAGYPESVADLLGGICTNAAPRSLWSRLPRSVEPVLLGEIRNLYSWPHLPQGAPTSPALANLCAFRVDCRLHGLADSMGAVYTRYADDLAFSGDEIFERCVERFATQAASILLEEGLIVNHRKTRIMRQGVRQYLAGLVTNGHLNVVREDFDRLKAILTNCVRHGAESQNRDAHPFFKLHLAGRVGFVEMVNPSKGDRLRKIFNQIVW
jgi:RNA-directed DNA polymerase